MEKNLGRIDYNTMPYRYFDKRGNEIREHDVVQFDDGRREEVYLTDRGELGTDATNRSWIKSGRATPCEYGIYPFEYGDLNSCVVIPWVMESRNRSMKLKEER